MTKSIFRYPGAKSSTRARQAIQQAFPSSFAEYRECFVGGGSIFFSMPTTTLRWINDLNPPLIDVYKALQQRPDDFIQACRDQAVSDPAAMKERFAELLRDDAADPAVRYFVLNRCAFNGRVRLDDPWRHRTFFSNPQGMSIVHGNRLLDAAKCLPAVKITCDDFAPVFDEPGHDVLVFADPPYVKDTELTQSAKLYEKGFTMDDHLRLKQCIDRCQHKVVLSYDDHPIIRDLYRDFIITPASWTYTGNDRRIVGRELIITNFEVTKEVAAAPRFGEADILPTAA